MVSLTDVQASNSRISTSLPPGLVAVFVGGTSGIGEITLKTFARYTNQPRAYIVGRSETAAERIIAECRVINSEGEYVFIKADVSLMKNVDKVCDEIKAKEKAVNLLFLSAGFPSLDGAETSEGLVVMSALMIYSRARFIMDLLPIIRTAPSLRRIITVAGGGREGQIYPEDYPARHLSFIKMRPHLIALTTLSMESLARDAPEVSFVHDYPGTVKTPLIDNGLGFIGVILRAWIFLFGWYVCIPLEECGERQLFLATSARFAPKERGKGADGVEVGDQSIVAKGSNGEVGSGVYSVSSDCESGSAASLKFLEQYRSQGLVEDVGNHINGEFKRIMGE
ncbi:hypothetical protein ONS95_013361 [Cadophora gregata]|uniref:uncharacterized protein n=1 Tax=Cadophora gregata TaxID=51156 RepID=UPI0026DDA1AF|nr:uncharacterized protein ONS95_013361 [Cadophora gregata]KAK0099746.1 hypothetical protein ONS96_008243 [Cadophora gregata f. sp. sojae]KAK0116340.1 hypothetical protein ONS95_013361 [Cadophora gregata]